MIRVTGLGVDYGNGCGLSGIDLGLVAGEAVALIGRSGAGKTTLLRCLAGTLRPTSGRIDASDPTGLLFQAHNLVGSMSVGRNVVAGNLGRWGAGRALRRALTGPSAGERCDAEAALASVGLSGFWPRLVSELSLGERQRVAVARLLVQRPRVVLADEPVASIDPVSARAVMDALFELKGEDGALLCSLHDTELALDRFDRVVALDDGSVGYDGATSSVPETLLCDLYAREASACPS